MTSEIVRLNLSSWAESQISAIINTTTPADLDKALDAFLTKDAKLTVNGATVSRSQYKTLLQQHDHIFQEIGVTVNFSGEVSVPADINNAIDAGSVGLFYTAVLTSGLFILGGHQQSRLTSSINLVIEQDTSIHLPPPPPFSVHGILPDRRRVTALNQVIVTEPIAPVIPGTSTQT